MASSSAKPKGYKETYQRLSRHVTPENMVSPGETRTFVVVPLKSTITRLGANLAPPHEGRARDD